MNLNQTILNECREEVAKENGFDSYAQYRVNSVCDSFEETTQFESKAALLAMEKQAEFWKWILKENEWKPCVWKGEERYVGEEYLETTGPFEDSWFKSELELYNIWREATTPQ